MKYLRRLNSIEDQNIENYVEPSLVLVDDDDQVYTNMEEYPWIVAEYKVNSLPAKIVSTNNNISGIYVNGKPYDGTSFDKTGDYKVFIIPMMKTIVTDAFNGCSSLTSVRIPSDVTRIEMNAFSGCSGLTSIEIPDSVTSIGRDAFKGCNYLNKVIVKNIAAWCNIYFNGLFSNPLYYANHIYSNENTEITKLIIPPSVISISPNSFIYCIGLTSITIPDSVTSIGYFAFSGCTRLTSITIPSSVTSIGNWAFGDCTGLTSLICLATTPPTLSGDTFYNTNNCPIYVPSGSVDAYKSSWSDYTSRIQSI